MFLLKLRFLEAMKGRSGVFSEKNRKVNSCSSVSLILRSGLSPSPVRPLSTHGEENFREAMAFKTRRLAAMNVKDAVKGLIELLQSLSTDLSSIFCEQGY